LRRRMRYKFLSQILVIIYILFHCTEWANPRVLPSCIWTKLKFTLCYLGEDS
jgi:hypothetical protein